jgi:hypothetical protein
MDTIVPMREPRPQGENTYRTPKGNVTIYPKETDANQLGFTLEFSTPPRETPRAPSSVLAHLRVFLTWALAKITPSYFDRPTTHSQLFKRVVPSILRDHLIIVTPPPTSPFPTWYPRSDHTRTWHSHETTFHAVQTLREHRIQEVYVFSIHIEHLGQQRVKTGDVIFICDTAIYITDEIGLLPPWSAWTEKFVVMEGHTLNREMVTVYLPARYAEPPSISEEDIIGGAESEEGSEGETRRDE